jgi:drug/metabolite transporter (DMT)-like permease
MAIALALAAAASWGLADFLAGLASRRVSVPIVLLLVEGGGLVVIALITLAAGSPFFDDPQDFWLAIAGGLSGVLGLGCFYRALAIGTMSIVAPLSATGAAIPVLIGVASGERPRAVQVVGMALAMVGVVLAAREAADSDAAARRTSQIAVVLALLAAVGFGSFFAMIDRAEESGDVAWILLAARTPSVLLLLAACALTRPRLPSRPAALGAIAAIGLFDLLANLFFVLATGRGLLSVVGVLAALSPAVTVLLARVLLHERLTRAQDAGVIVTLAGVVALAAGA